jgi:hypothetical protein
MMVPETTARVGCRPPAPFGWGSRTRRRDLWHPLSLRDRSREDSVPRARPSSPSFVGSPVFSHVARTPLDTDPLEQVPGLSPGRLPSARFSTLRPSEESRGPCYVLAKLFAPLSPDSFGPSSSGTGRRPALSRAASVCLSAPLRSAKKMLLTDFCNRLTIRAPVNRSITERTTYVALTPQALPLAVPGAETPNANERSSCVASDHLAIIRPRLASRLTAQDQLRSGAARCCRLVLSRGSKRRGALSRVPAPPECFLLR